MTPFPRYRSYTPLHKAVSWIIKHLPLPEWFTIETRYSTVPVPKSFRALTMVPDLVELEIRKWLENLFRAISTSS